MDRFQAIKLMAKYLNGLNKRERARLRRHVETGTKVLCGRDYDEFLDGLGGGWPAVLACSIKLPRKAIHNSRAYDRIVEKRHNKMLDKISPDGRQMYLDALEALTEYEMKIIMATLRP